MRTTAVSLLLGAVSVYAHGHVVEVSSDVGGTKPGTNPYGGSGGDAVTFKPFAHEGEGAYLLPQRWTDPSVMSCETTEAPSSAIDVRPGGSVTVGWEGATGELDGQPGVGGFPGKHAWVHAIGTVSDYITSQTDDVVNADWVRLSHAGLDSGSPVDGGLRGTMERKGEPYFGEGTWGMAKLVADGSRHTIQIPNLAAGRYVIRHEITALHNPKSSAPSSGPQMYVSCIAINVQSGGSQTLPGGTKSSALYSPEGSLANYNHFTGAGYSFDGPAIWDGASSGGGAPTNNNGGGGAPAAEAPAAEAPAAEAPAAEAPAAETPAETQPAPQTGKCKQRNTKRRRAAVANSLRMHKKRINTGTF